MEPTTQVCALTKDDLQPFGVWDDVPTNGPAWPGPERQPFNTNLKHAVRLSNQLRRMYVLQMAFISKFSIHSNGLRLIY